jgi:hypothetical protein
MEEHEEEDAVVIESQTMETRSGEDISTFLSALFDFSMSATARCSSSIADINAVLPSFKRRRDQQ